MNDQITAYPLQWPFCRPRVSRREDARFDRDVSFGRVRDEMYAELSRFGASSVVISSNVALRLDDRAENLEWCTGAENTHHAIRNNLSPLGRGEVNPSAKLTRNDVRNVLEMIRDGESNVSIAKRYSLNPQTISRIRTGKTWREVTLDAA